MKSKQELLQLVRQKMRQKNGTPIVAYRIPPRQPHIQISPKTGEITGVTEIDLVDWALRYPCVQVRSELIEIATWVAAKIKAGTYNTIPDPYRFIDRWLQRANADEEAGEAW